ncbi:MULTISPECIES: tryptophan halogenase family protein [unclassified Marinovum]
MADQIKTVTIVGGGTAGWLTALMLRTLSEKSLHVQLIESPNIPTVGVGEATVPQMPLTLSMLKIPTREFFKRCNTTFKLGVMFKQWNVGPDGKMVDYINPFGKPQILGGVDACVYHQRFGSGGRAFAQTFSPSLDLARLNKGPMSIEVGKNVPGVGFAYHLDAGAFAKMMAEIGTERGIEHILDDVEDVALDDKGNVSGIQLKERGLHPVEFVIDCTGFKGLIINKALKVPFIDYSKYLGNNRAMALQIPHPDPTKITSCTSSTALGAGWVWRVPLFHRIGTGYVFSSAHRTDEEARDEFMAHLGSDAPKGAEPRIIPMRVGRSQTFWEKNCVAIGLSSGFIEPLESTAIHMIDLAIQRLLLYFPDTDFAEAKRKRYNEAMEALYSEVLDFICLHYALGNRTDDPYWIAAREDLAVPDSLAENLELWKMQPPGPLDLATGHLFDHPTYQAVLMGKRVYETGFGDGSVHRRAAMNREAWVKQLKEYDTRRQGILNACSDHRLGLMAIRGELEPAGARGGPLPGLGAPMKAGARAGMRIKQGVSADPLDTDAPGLF